MRTVQTIVMGLLAAGGLAAACSSGSPSNKGSTSGLGDAGGTTGSGVGDTGGTTGAACAKLVADSIAGNGLFVFALVGGAVYYWGAYGYCNDLAARPPLEILPTRVPGIANAVAVAASTAHACAVLADGSLQCWGCDNDGELGDGTTTNTSVPVQVSGITAAVAVAAGAMHTCALLTGGTIQCWGRNEHGQLGSGASSSALSPVLTPTVVSNITNAVGVAVGDIHTCALLNDGEVRCWGGNEMHPVALDGVYGVLGNGNTTDYRSLAPVAVSGITNAIAIAADYASTCALLGNGTIQCWGDNGRGQLGDGTKTDRSVPITVSGIANAAAVAVGTTHSCAVLASGVVQCWGSNDSGQLGNGTTTDSLVPVTVSEITNAVAVVVGQSHSCAMLAGGTVQCWGYPTHDWELGPGGARTSPVPYTGNSSVPVTVICF